MAKLGGSPDLDPEKAAMLTAGVVYLPEFLEGFDLTLDYYTTRIEDGIGALPAGLILSNCYSQDAPSNCDQVVRDTDTHLIDRILATNANIGETETSGVDFGLGYATATPIGIVSAQLESHRLVRYDQILPSAGGPELVKGKGYYDLGVFPAWRHAASAGLARRRFSAGLTLALHRRLRGVRGGRLQGQIPPGRGEGTFEPKGRFEQHLQPAWVVRAGYRLRALLADRR